MVRKISVACWVCYRSGRIRHRDTIGVVRFKRCTRCRGLGKLFVEEGSEQHKKSLKVGATGIWPGIRKGYYKYDAAGFKKVK